MPSSGAGSVPDCPPHTRGDTVPLTPLVPGSSLQQPNRRMHTEYPEVGEGHVNLGPAPSGWEVSKNYKNTANNDQNLNKTPQLRDQSGVDPKRAARM